MESRDRHGLGVDSVPWQAGLDRRGRPSGEVLLPGRTGMRARVNSAQMAAGGNRVDDKEAPRVIARGLRSSRRGESNP